jgi:predicted transcriptional regulator
MPTVGKFSTIPGVVTSEDRPARVHRLATHRKRRSFALPRIDDLFVAMAEAVSANDQDRFDALERDLLAHFDGSFSGMPSEMYERYLEVDRGWPAAVQPGSASAGAGRARGNSKASSRRALGPRTSISVRLPEAHVEWLTELAAASSASRSGVLTACLSIICENPAVVAAVQSELRAAEESEPVAPQTPADTDGD